MAIKKFQFLEFTANPTDVLVHAQATILNVPANYRITRVLAECTKFFNAGNAIMSMASVNISENASSPIYFPPQEIQVPIGQIFPSKSFFFGDNPQWKDCDILLEGGLNYTVDAYGYFPALAVGDSGSIYCTLEFEV